MIPKTKVFLPLENGGENYKTVVKTNARLAKHRDSGLALHLAERRLYLPLPHFQIKKEVKLKNAGTFFLTLYD